MSIDEKERPAIKQHLQGVYKDVLSSAPEDISLAFEDEVIVEMLETSEEDDGGVLRISTFRVIGRWCCMCKLFFYLWFDNNYSSHANRLLFYVLIRKAFSIAPLLKDCQPQD